MLLGRRHDLADAAQYQVHLRFVASKKKPMRVIGTLLQGVSLEHRRRVAQRVTGKGNKGDVLCLVTQQLVQAALDAYLADMPGLGEMVEKAPSTKAAN